MSFFAVFSVPLRKGSENRTNREAVLFVIDRKILICQTLSGQSQSAVFKNTSFVWSR